MKIGWRPALLASAVIVLALLILAEFWPSDNPFREPPKLRPFSLDSRPASGRYLFDYAGSLAHYEEGAQLYLQRMERLFHIEAIIVTLPALPEGFHPSGLAVELANNWRIGGAFEGRGLLLLLIEQDKQVKLEVTYELEDVFTDTFSGYVEDLQLRPYYLNDDIGTGLIAVMEELEQRAQLKEQGDYTPGVIARLDSELMAGGAGARRSLERYEDASPSSGAMARPAGAGARSPKEAWTVMLTKWAGNGADIDVDVYTEMSKLALGDPDKPDPRIRREVPYWQNAGYQILQDAEHAVIWFGAIDGWNNAPFLFCLTPDGWKYDVVHQRRLVVMAEAPKWMIEQGDYPYVSLLRGARQSTGKDLPLSATDLYRCKDDVSLANQIGELERALADAPNDIAVLQSLARLNVITGRRPNHVRPILSRFRKLAPDNPDAWKYSAIYNVNSFFQYGTALKEMQTYQDLRPGDAFGHNFIGFLYYRLGDYEASIESLTKAIELQADNVYAYALAARDYALLYRKAKTRISQNRYRRHALDMLEKAANAPTPDTARVERLRAWLEKRL